MFFHIGGELFNHQIGQTIWIVQVILNAGAFGSEFILLAAYLEGQQRSGHQPGSLYWGGGLSLWKLE